MLVDHQNRMMVFKANQPDSEPEEQENNNPNGDLPLPVQRPRGHFQKTLPSQLFLNLLKQNETNETLLKDQVVAQITQVRQLIRQTKLSNTAGFHRAQALYMQFKSHVTLADFVAFEEYVTLVQQAGASFSVLNGY